MHLASNHKLLHLRKLPFWIIHENSVNTWKVSIDVCVDVLVGGVHMCGCSMLSLTVSVTCLLFNMTKLELNGLCCECIFCLFSYYVPYGV